MSVREGARAGVNLTRTMSALPGTDAQGSAALPWPGRRVATAGASVRLVRAGVAAAVVLLTAGSVALRVGVLHGGFWVDEGLSVGIASHPLGQVPGLLIQDGAPPLYYVLLHGWMNLFGRSEVRTHELSLLFAILTVPAAWWAGASLLGRRVGLTCCALAAASPFLTAYAHETRMYSLLALLSLLATACFLHVFVRGRRRWLPGFVAALTLALYTHNWGAFLAATAGVAFLVCLWRAEPGRRRALALDGAIAFGATGLLFAPWVPTVLAQAAHTGSPWSRTPGVAALLHAGAILSGGLVAFGVLLVAAGLGLVRIWRAGERSERTLVACLVLLGAGTLLAAWGFSQLAPAWASRYFAVALGPLLLAAALGLSRAGRLGLAGLVVVLGISVLAPTNPAYLHKSNVREVSAAIRPDLHRGDLVLSLQPEQVPVLRYYLGGGLRWATNLGPAPDTGIMDWRDALARLQAATWERNLPPLLSRVRVGEQLLLVLPIPRGSRGAPWPRLVRHRELEWFGAMLRDRRFAVVQNLRTPGLTPASVRLVLFRRVR